MDHLKKQMTREDVLQRFEATRKKKQEYITKLEKELKAEFKTIVEKAVRSELYG